MGRMRRAALNITAGLGLLLGSNVPHGERPAEELTSPPALATYELLKEDEDVLGRVVVRENSIEADVYYDPFLLPRIPIYHIVFSEPAQQDYHEQRKIPLLGKEGFSYRKGPLRLDTYEYSALSYHEDKERLVGTTYDEGTLTPVGLLENIVSGSLPDTARVVVLGLTYRLPLTHKRTLPGGDALIGVEFLDLKEDKNDQLYLNDQGEIIIDEDGILREARLLMTEVEYKRGERYERQLPVTIRLQEVRREALLRAYQSSPDK